MGEVYQAEHVKMGRRCAIKIMTPGTMSDPDAISRFNREAANASRINHPNACQIYDFGETPEGLIYLAMELIDGKSLTALLDDTPTMPLARAATMIEQCAEALHVAHELGIVHRDLKPDNIMVITARGKDTVKVVDFGIAKAMSGEESGKQNVTKTGFVVGTPEYMSPEQLAGDKVDGRSDIYSLGLVFYRMLTGSSPFPADSQQETMIKRLTDDPIPLASARPDVRFPVELQRLMDRTLARTPSGRYAHAADLARDVRRLRTTITGAVDVEAGTQVVHADEIRAAIPPTRIDPQAAMPRARAATPPTNRAPAELAVRKGPPLVPIAATVVVLAVAGGLYVMRNNGNGPAPADSTARLDTAAQHQGQHPAGGLPGATDTSKLAMPPTPLGDTTTKPAGSGSVKPPVTRPVHGGGDSASANPQRPPADLAAMEREVDVYLNDPGFTDVDSKRKAAKQIGEQLYTITSAPDTLRARGAFLMGYSLLAEGDRSGARTWYRRAVKLDPSKDSWKSTLAQLEQS